MKIELRDELAARVASTLADRPLSPPEVARRAYAIADAMLLERDGATPEAITAAREDDLDRGGAIEGGVARGAIDPGPPHDPGWEIEPRWTREDARRRDRAIARHDERGPGLASARPPLEEDDAKTG